MDFKAIPSSLKNPARPQDRVQDLVDHFHQFGDVMFRQQRLIYAAIGELISDSHTRVLEAGCGNGVGSARLERALNRRSSSLVSFTATDKNPSNVQFADKLYPWINFGVWDITANPLPQRFDSVVCVETLEHVDDPEKAIANLLNSTRHDLWISTPRGTPHPTLPPSNPYHVYEFTPQDLISLVQAVSSKSTIEFYDWQTFIPELCDAATTPNPMLIRVR